jgi:hypothetical protein
MSVISVDGTSSASSSGQKPIGFWRRLALDWTNTSSIEPEGAVPQATLRRSRQDFERCRRLMHKA